MDDPRSNPVGATEPNGSRGRDHALAGKLPVLRATLERQLRFRREQLGQLENRAEGREHASGAEPCDGCDPGAALALREVNALVIAGAWRALTDIELALERMRQGRYGRCRSCGTLIPLAVLEAIPKTTRCLTCQARCDQGDHQPTPRTSVPATRPGRRRT